MQKRPLQGVKQQRPKAQRCTARRLHERLEATGYTGYRINVTPPK